MVAALETRAVTLGDTMRKGSQTVIVRMLQSLMPNVFGARLAMQSMLPGKLDVLLTVHRSNATSFVVNMRLATHITHANLSVPVCVIMKYQKAASMTGLLTNMNSWIQRLKE